MSHEAVTSVSDVSDTETILLPQFLPHGRYFIDVHQMDE